MKKHKPLIQKDGRFNIQKIGGRSAPLRDLYYEVLRSRWSTFLLLIGLVYLGLNLIFAFLYLRAGEGSLSVPVFDLWHCFLFSVQTMSTIGYGTYAPLTDAAHLIVVVESMVGLLFVALTTGLVFSKFSRVTGRMLFSKNILITTHNGKRVLMFRVGNSRSNHIVDASVNVVILKTEHTQEGQLFKKIYDLELERSTSPVFSLSWTVIHEIKEGSPLYGLTPQELDDMDALFIVSLAGTDDTFAQHIHTKHTYYFDDLVWDRRFEDVISILDDGTRVLNLTKMHDLK